MFNVITSDLHTLPLCINNARNIDELYEQLPMWSTSGVMTEAEILSIYRLLVESKPPNDGLLGMAVTEQFTYSGMRMHICHEGDVASSLGAYVPEMVIAAFKLVVAYDEELHKKTWQGYEELCRAVAKANMNTKGGPIPKTLYPEGTDAYVRLLVADDVAAFVNRVRSYQYAISQGEEA